MESATLSPASLSPAALEQDQSTIAVTPRVDDRELALEESTSDIQVPNTDSTSNTLFDIWFEDRQIQDVVRERKSKREDELELALDAAELAKKCKALTEGANRHAVLKEAVRGAVPYTASPSYVFNYITQDGRSKTTQWKGIPVPQFSMEFVNSAVPTVGFIGLKGVMGKVSPRMGNPGSLAVGIAEKIFECYQVNVNKQAAVDALHTAIFQLLDELSPVEGGDVKEARGLVHPQGIEANERVISTQI